MPESSVTPTDQLLKAIEEMAASQQRQIALLRGLLAFAAPWQDVCLGQPGSTDDVCDCEICGGYVAAPEMDPFAKRHGAVIHVNCISAQMAAR